MIWVCVRLYGSDLLDCIASQQDGGPSDQVIIIITNNSLTFSNVITFDTSQHRDFRKTMAIKEQSWFASDSGINGKLMTNLGT